MRRSVSVFLIASVAAAWWPAGATSASSGDGRNDTYRLHGAFSATPTIIGTCPAGPPAQPPLVVPMEITVEGTGVLSHLGRSRVTIEETALGVCLGGPIPVPIAVLTANLTYVAANGDVLVAASRSTTPIEPVPGTPLFAFSSVDEVLPTGTGRFDDATGLLQTDVTFDPTVAPIAAHFTVDGEITLPKS